MALKAANSHSPEMIFPFRAEDLTVLKWAEEKTGDWKPRYYRALIYWANQQDEKAKELMEGCEPEGFAPFYLSRALMKEGDAKLQDIFTKAEAIDDTFTIKKTGADAADIVS